MFGEHTCVGESMEPRPGGFSERKIKRKLPKCSSGASPQAASAGDGIGVVKGV